MSSARLTKSCRRARCSGDVAQHGGQAARVLEEEPVLLAQLGRELLFLAEEQLELLVGLDAFVLGLGQGLQGLEVALAQAIDLLGAGEAGLPGFVESGLGPGDLGPLGAELFLESREAGLVILDLTGQEEDVLEELVAVGLGALLRLLEILDPFRLALDVALDAGGLGSEGEELLLAFLERFFPVPKVLAAGGGVLFPFAQAGRGLVLAEEALFVEPRGLLPGLFEDDELPLVVVGGQLADALAQAPVAVGRLGLALEGVLGLLDLDDDVLEPDEVLLGAVELRLGLALLVLVIGRARGLLDERPLLGRLGGDEVADRALLDDEVFGAADGVFPELVLDVLEADGLAVHPVFALAGAEGPVGDGQLLVVPGQGQDGVGHAQGGPLGVAGEDDLIGPVAADGLLAVPAEGPEHGVDEVALARAVGADDGGDAGVEDDLGPLGEGLESLQFELLDDHAHGVEALSVECARPGGRTERVLYANPSHFGRGHDAAAVRVPVLPEYPSPAIVIEWKRRASGTPERGGRGTCTPGTCPRPPKGGSDVPRRTVRARQGTAGEGRGAAFGRAPPRGRAGLPDHGAAPAGGRPADRRRIRASSSSPPCRRTRCLRPRRGPGIPGRGSRRGGPPSSAADPWRVAPVAIPDGIVEEAGFGADGMPGGIEGGVDYGVDAGLPSDIVGSALYALVGEPVEPVVRAAGDVRPPRLVKRVEPEYPAIAREARIEGTVILEATTDVFGRVTNVRVLRSVQFLDEAAVGRRPAMGLRAAHAQRPAPAGDLHRHRPLRPAEVGKRGHVPGYVSSVFVSGRVPILLFLAPSL